MALCYERSLRKWSDSYILTVPPVVVENLGAEEGTSVEVTLESKEK